MIGHFIFKYPKVCKHKREKMIDFHDQILKWSSTQAVWRLFLPKMIKDLSGICTEMNS